MRKIIYFMTAAFLIGACQSNGNHTETTDGQDSLQTQDTSPKVVSTEKLWETPAEFKVPESVLFDAKENVLYVANVDGKPTDKDGKGSISKLSTDGTIISLDWVTGLDAPKGMGIFEGTLYVSNINELVAIDMATAKVSKRFAAPEALFLNDISIDANGTVFVSDMQAHCIYALKDGTFEKWLDDEQLETVNGLFVEGDVLYAGTNAIWSIKIADKSLTKVMDSPAGIDGLVRDGEDFIFSDWSGSVFFATAAGEVTKLSDTSADKINAADIGFIPASKTILVPTFFDNRVVAYQLNK